MIVLISHVNHLISYLVSPCVFIPLLQPNWPTCIQYDLKVCSLFVKKKCILLIVWQKSRQGLGHFRPFRREMLLPVHPPVVGLS